MSKELTNLQDLRSAFVSHCKTLGCSIDYITMCQIMFANIENALKENEKKLKALEVIKECFDFNGFEEFIPNSKWYQSESKQKLLKEVLL